MPIAEERPLVCSMAFGKDGRDAAIPYFVTGAASMEEAIETARAQAEAVPPVSILAGFEMGKVAVTEEVLIEDSGLRAYYVTVNFSSRDQKEKEDGDETLQLSTTGGTEKITQALSQTAWGPLGENDAPYVGLGINVTSDNIEGVEQPAPKMEFTINHWWNPLLITMDYIRNVTRSGGKTNLYPWRGFDVGELMFLGAEIPETGGKKPIKVPYKFAFSENATDLLIERPDGESILIPYKAGWEYLWTRTKKKEDTVKKKVTLIVDAAYVATTKEAFDFASVLGLAG